MYHAHSSHSIPFDLKGMLSDLAHEPGGYAKMLAWLCDCLDRHYGEHYSDYLSKVRIGALTFEERISGCDGWPALWWAGGAARDYEDEAYLSASRIIEDSDSDEEASSEDEWQTLHLLEIISGG